MIKCSELLVHDTRRLHSNEGPASKSAAENGRTISAKPRPRADNVVNLMDALKKSIASESPKAKKSRKASAGQKEMLLPIEGKKPAAKKAAKPERATGRRKAG
jgi:DNA end-binding protein Ku